VLFSTRFAPHVLLATAVSLSVCRSCVEGGGQGNAGVVVVWVILSWHLGGFISPVVSQSLVCRPRSVGVEVLRSTLAVPGCCVHHDVLPCRGRDLAEEEVNLSRRSLFVVVRFVAVATVCVAVVAVVTAVVAVAVTAVLSSLRLCAV
jgi:hypothetical protein